MAQVVDVTVGAKAADDGGTWRCRDGVALVAAGDFTVVTDADAGLLAPDVGPPRTFWGGANHRAFGGEGLLVGGVGCLAEFAVDFVLVGVGEELGEQSVGCGEFEDGFGCQQGDEPFLPVVVAAFDFAFGLGRGGVEEFDAVEVEGRAELGEGIGVVGIEEGVEVHVESEGQAVGLEGAGKEVEVGQEGFCGIAPRAGVEAGGVVEDFKEDLLVGRAGQEGVGRGVVLPEGGVVAGLPAFDGFGRGFVAGVGSVFVFDGPAADAGAVGLEVQPAVEFAGDTTVGARRFGGEEFGGKGAGFGGPLWVMVAAGEPRRPSVGLAVGAGVEITGVEFVEAGTGQAQLSGGGAGADLADAITVKEMTDERSGVTFDQLKFFIGPKVAGKVDLSHWN